MGADIGGRPLLLMGFCSFLTGVQLVCFGLLAELQMRTYHESQNRPIYRVRALLRQPRSDALEPRAGVAGAPGCRG
jgi:hypothetical protein